MITATPSMPRHDPGLLEERMTLFGACQPAWDRALIVLLSVLIVAWFRVMPLDAERLRWSHAPTWLQAAAGSCWSRRSSCSS